MTPPTPRVVVAVIDDAIPFAHYRFRDTNGDTRFDSIWQQDGLGPNPPWFNYGAWLTRASLNTLLANATTKGISESEVYAISGVEDYSRPAHKPLGRRTAHGAHIADLACGFEPKDAPPGQVLMGVQLDQAAVQAMLPVPLSVHIVNALALVVRRTRQLEAASSRRLPIVVNLSYGWHTGPHDGTSLLESAIDMMVRARRKIAPMCVVLPAGNSRLLRTHANFDLGATGQARNSETLQWKLLPDDRTSSRLELWLGSPSDAVTVTVASPSSTTLGTFPLGHFGPLTLSGQTVGWLDSKTLVGPTGRRGIRIHLARTAPLRPLDASASVAESGAWSLTVRNVGASSCHIDAWIDRDGGLHGWPIVGRQSRFEDARYVRLDEAGRVVEFDPMPLTSPVTRLGTLNGAATGEETIVVGGLIEQDLSSSRYSSLGPAIGQGGGGVRSGHAPDVATRSDDSRSLHGVLAGGSHSGSAVALDGTSVAAPQVTRWLANQVLTGATNGRAAVRTRAQQQESLRPPSTFPGSVAAGDGRLEIDLAALAWGRTTRR